MKLTAVCSMALSTLLSIISGSAAVRVERYNFAMDVKFKKFKTYRWVEIQDAQKVDEQGIKGALDAQLSKKKLTKANGDTADLYICYQEAVGAEKHFAFYRRDWRYGPGWYLEGWWVGFFEKKEGEISTIHAGELALDMYDSKNHYLVWRGVVGKVLDIGETPDKQEKSLKKSVAKLLKKYPPPPLDSWSGSD